MLAQRVATLSSHGLEYIALPEIRQETICVTAFFAFTWVIGIGKKAFSVTGGGFYLENQSTVDLFLKEEA